MINALFVDDDPDVLEGLENRIFSIREQIQGTFASSAKEALDLLSKRAFDAVVSDMRMPVMDGAALLLKVKSEYPKAIRIILSGDTGPAGFMRAMHVAHQVLSKPCDAAQLSRALEECIALQKMITSPEIVACVGRFHKLPSAPRICQRLDQVMASDRMQIADISSVIEQDPSMTARILQVVNSAYFSTRSPIDTVHNAVRFLGTEMIRSLAVAHELYHSLAHSASLGTQQRLNKLQSEALISAQFAKTLTELTELKPLAFTAGMLRNIGYIATLHVNGECKVNTTADVKLVGAYLMSIWGLPFRLVEAVAYADTPSLREKSFPPRNNLSAVMHLAGIFLERYLSGVDIDTPIEPANADANYLKSSGLNDSTLKQLELRCRSSLALERGTYD